MTDRLVGSYRPQHDEECAKRTTCRWCHKPSSRDSHYLGHYFEPDSTVDCDCGLESALARESSSQQEIERLKGELTNQLSDAEIEGLRAGIADLQAGRIVSLETMDWKSRAEAAEAENTRLQGQNNAQQDT